MKSMRSLVAVLLVVGGLAALGTAAESGAKTTLSVKGMTCGGCTATVKIQLKKTEGVIGYEVSLKKAEAEVTYDPTVTEPKTIAESVSKTGFQATVKDEKEKAN